MGKINVNIEAGHAEFRQALSYKLEAVVREYETDDKIILNMIGDVSWSLKTWIMDTDFFSKGKGCLHYTEGEGGELTSISASFITPVDFFAGPSARVMTRMWLSPKVRTQAFIAKTHLPGALEFARSEGLRAVWTSMNSDRTALVRKVNMLKTSEEPFIADTWKPWQVMAELQLINQVMQTVMYRAV